MRIAMRWCVVWACLAAGAVQAQTTNAWTNNTSAAWWSTPGNWLIQTGTGPDLWTSTNFFPNGVGTVALVTNDIGDQTIYLTNDVTVGKLVWGDMGTGSLRDLRSTNATPSTLTFDNGANGVMALFEHGTGDRLGLTGNFGRFDDDFDLPVTVADADGLFIDNWQNFSFHNTFNNVPARVFDGGGHNVTKGEDGGLYFRGYVTNIATFHQRDGWVEFQPEGLAAKQPGISNLVMGVAPGTVDVGANPDTGGAVTNIAEGTVNDRVQLPYFSIIGANTTNFTAAGAVTNFGAAVTNGMQITMNRGVFRSYNRLLAFTNNAPVTVYTGGVTLNGSNNESIFLIENQDNGNYTSGQRQQIFAGQFTGTGGFTKMGTAEMTLITNNSFTGDLAINRSYDRGKGYWGGIGLRDNGTLDGVNSITLNRDGQLFLDNSGINLTNRVNDGAYIISRGRNAIEIKGNASDASYEKFGAVSNLMGTMTFEYDRIDGSARAITNDIASLYRAPGSIVTFQSSDLEQGAFANNSITSIVINLADSGASLTQVGSGGGPGTVNRSVVVGVFGGDGVDYQSTDPAQQTPARADEFMTVEGTRLRTLLPNEMVSLGGRSTNALNISQASAASDANVNIDFMAREELLGNNGLTNAGNPDLITKRVIESATFNSIRFGLARGTNGAPNDQGRSLVMLDGLKLASESGMLLIGRDIGSTNGDVNANGSMYLQGGTLDLDGASGNREAIVHNNSGLNFYIRSVLEATNGFTKSGENSVILQNANRMGGVATINQGNLYMNDGNALRGVSEIQVQGNGQFYLQWGIAVTNANLRMGERPYTLDGSLIADNNHNIFGGDILIDNVDPNGIIIHEARINASGQNASLTLLGDIGLTGELPSADINLHDSQVVRTGGSQGIINLYGTFGDRIVDGQAVPFDPTNRSPYYVRVESGNITNRANSENDLLRFRVDGSGLTGDELVVNISNSWNAAGRFYLEQGTVRFLGDPNAGEGKGNFWTSNALAVANFANGNSGFYMALDGSDNGNNNAAVGASATFLLTKDGQAFNSERWQVSPDYFNNTMTMGLEHSGPSNATVTIGNQWMDANPATDDNRINFTGYDEARRREFRLFSQNGYDSGTGLASTGNVNVVMSLLGQGFGTLAKVGNGVVTLLGQTNGFQDEVNDIRYLTLQGGELVLDRSQAGYPNDVRRLTDQTSGQLTLAGGDLTYRGGGGANADERISSNLFVRAGDSRVVVVGSPLGTTELLLANNHGSQIVRQRGGTVQFVEDQPGLGLANIRLGGTPANSRVGSWATYGNSYGQGAFTWAATDANSNLVAFTGFSTDTYGAGLHTDVTVGTNLAADIQTASMRFSGGVGIDLGGNQLDVTEGGILIVPAVTSASGISNGTLFSFGGEVIVHNYHGVGGDFAIGAAITGAVDVTFSGTGGSTLSGANTYTGITRLNGGIVTIDGASRLGSVTNLEFRGGGLATTTTTDLGNRKIVLGGDGGTFQVAAGTSNTIQGQIDTEDHFILNTRGNNGHGDLLKTGAGTLVFGGANTVTNLYEGLTDVRGGTLLITRNNDNVLGSSKSFYDGTIVRSGATLAVSAMTNFGNVTLNSREWLMFEQGSTLDIYDPQGGYQGYRHNGVIDLRGDTIINVRGDEFNFGSDGAGYLMGSGALIKEGNGMFQVQTYSPEFTGKIIVRDGNMYDYVYRNSFLPNAHSITLGTNDAVNRGGVTFLVRPSRDGNNAEIDINQNVTVLGHSDAMRLGIYGGDHNDIVNYNGDIDLSGFNTLTNNIQFQLYAEDDVSAFDIGAATEYRSEYFVNFKGDISGGNKGIRTYLYQTAYSGPSYGQSMDNGLTTTNEFDMKAFFTLSGDNSGWTGYLETGNRPGTNPYGDGPDKDKQHFVRFGNNDGNATLAISSNNAVVMRHDATLQAYGSLVTIGSLFSDGDSGGSDGYFGNQFVTNTFLENGGSTAGTFTIVQSSNRTFQGVIRDGTYYSPTMTNLASAALNIIKAGPGILTFDRSNYYTGSTVIDEGILRVNGFHANGGQYTVNVGGTLGGTGVIDAAVLVQGSGTLAPGVGLGTLTIDGDLTLTANAISAFELNAGASNLVIAGAGLNDYIRGIDNLVLDGGLNVTWSSLDVTNATEGSYWTLFQYDTSLSNLYLDINTLPALADPTLSWGVDTFSVLGEVRLAVVPEPYTWLLVLFGLGIIAARFRRTPR